MATDANKAVADAKTALHNADNFGQRETGNKKAGDPAPKAESSAAPSYTHARAARASSGLDSEVESAAAGLKAKQDNVDAYVASTQ